MGFPSIYKANLVVLVWVFVCGSSPFACLLRCCFLLRNANLAGGFACHRCWCCVFLVFVSRYLPRYYGTKEFHNVFNWFNRSSQCSDRASERNRPTEEKNTKSMRMVRIFPYDCLSNMSHRMSFQCINSALAACVSIRLFLFLAPATS